ncbi:hypothetical protein LTR91_003614 [Friedmanniomyces endolithicus]|uniref:DhaL domain-containing protein n=1 Tax=Friedmanniomyces endolithicus TaxID=329885 RepID=A0AAN6FW68_9PEZI|nr:hypothetical protein LTS09_015919 [Friedmanniomyces endolithicus]KAK0268178.1 hypothetical protein LTR35_015724 [Friedmanniomyces endolithicus]KAK0293371.1 hypothetical protein LTS00_007617 [Friedmanniomyces endolithicus]KAK0325560.1 hypothetical protein LTR82_003095 [Friedmanniomyces endolithicus]KAK0911516.1 hypothetical protein LTR57_015340 [Friedmanniomyces endolithicus]
MAIVVEQTIPFSAPSLDLHNSQRWNQLLPLIRPSLKVVQTARNQPILVDVALAKSTFVHIAAVGTTGAFSSKLLDDRNVTAIVTGQAGAGLPTSTEIQDAMQSAGVAKSQGVVIARAGKKRRVELQGEGLVEIEAGGALELDHIMHLLANAKEACRKSVQDVTELLKLFMENASTAHSKFHVEKAGGKPAMLHFEGAAGYEKAKHAVERDLKHAMKAHSAQEGEVTYNVHYSDVNGLSRLENYIIAGEIAQYLESQSIPYRLSHSTIVDHSDAARGFSISICPIPTRFLAPQPKPHQHKAASTQDDTALTQTLSQSKPHLTFHDADVRQRIQSGCAAVISAEPTITEYDTIVGDGDCGYTLRDGAKQVLAFIRARDLTRLPETLAQLVAELEVNMGGTSGALYCIFLTALASALASETTVAGALKEALGQLMKYTRARLGDRTMMDALIPFVETLERTGDVGQAVREMRAGVEGTKTMEASLGRSAYLDESATRGVPDPGAYGMLVLLEGMAEV